MGTPREFRTLPSATLLDDPYLYLWDSLCSPRVQGTVPVPTASTPTSSSLPIFSFPFVGSITGSSNQAVRFPAEGSSEWGGGDKLGLAPPGNTGPLFEITEQVSRTGAPYNTGGIWDLSTAVCAQRSIPSITAGRRARAPGDALHVNWEANVLTTLVCHGPQC